MKKYIGELKQHPEALFILGYMLFPLLALVVAVLGFFMVLGGYKLFRPDPAAGTDTDLHLCSHVGDQEPQAAH